MSPHKKLLKAIQNLFREMVQIAKAVTKKLMNWLLRSILVTGKKANLANAGFILPTVTMVILVVILLTTAMLFRSFERSKNASNVRVSQAVLAAAGPGVERAKAKIQQLLADPTLPRSTPTDVALYGAMTGQLPGYTLGDEEPLKIVHDFDGGGIGSNAEKSLTTAWRFPVDTDNNGKFDSYTLYGLYFRTPTPSTTNPRPRNFVESRTPPMSSNSGGDACNNTGGASTSASLVGSTGWYKTPEGNLEKSFFVFSTTVPITPPAGVATTASHPRGATFEYYTGNKGFSAIEYQQDQARIPLSNNAVVYEDDLEITPGSPLKLNGRIMTNGNFITGARTNSSVEYYQVSSTNSCFYKEENGKINVGGNLLIGSAESAAAATGNVKIHLYRTGAVPADSNLGTAHKSVNNTAPQASSNSQAYARRIDDLVQKGRGVAQPKEVKDKTKAGVDLDKALQDYFKQRTRRVPFAEVPTNATLVQTLGSGSGLQDGGSDKMRPSDVWSYPVIPDAVTGATNGGSTNGLTLVRNQPPARDPATIIDGRESELGDRILVGNGLPAKWWDKTQQEFVDFYSQTPQPVGGNTEWNGSNEPRTRMTQVVPLSELGETDRDGFWERQAAHKPDQPLDGWGGLRVVTGAGVYNPDLIIGGNYNPNAPARASFLPRRPNATTPIIPPIKDNFSTRENEAAQDSLVTPARVEGFTVVFPDSMPMWQDNGDGAPQLPPLDKRGDLVMRATAVYHYRSSDYPYDPTAPYPDPAAAYQAPIACVSSYYNPSTKVTARNTTALANLFPGPAGVAIASDVPAGATGLSNNGISYNPPTINASNINTGSQDPVTGAFITPVPRFAGGMRARLNYQANLIFPDGRFVNPQLRQALKRLDGQLGTVTKLTLAEQSAIDSTVCALQIADGTLIPNNSVIPDGAIYETAFLDARQVKAVEGTDATPNNYDLSIEERQPLEIRATVLNLDALRRRGIAGTGTQPVPAPEYLLPDSGIIYATRDDALLDMSAPGDDPLPTASPTTQVEENRRVATQRINSPVDFQLDPARRPNGIMLTDGSKLARGGDTNTYKQTEKGLILATNLPVYVKADDDGTNSFNRHQSPGGQLLEEFVEKLAVIGNWNKNQFYNRTNLEPNFACRRNQPGLSSCTLSDLWRPATVLADSVTLLSNNFRFGFRDEGDYDLRKNVENLSKNQVLLGYDFNAVGGISGLIPLSEAQLGIDLNGDGTTNAAANTVPESEVTITATRRLNGFFDNNYLTSANWFDTSTAYPKDFETFSGQQGSSYVNNFVTPIQRRANFPEYVMEICRKPLVSECQPNDWVVNISGGVGVKASTIAAGTLVAQLRGSVTTAGSGTTARLPLRPADQRYPRRVAFLRNTANNQLVLDPKNRPVPLGIDATDKVQYYSYSGTAIPIGGKTTVAGLPPAKANALWFRTTASNDPNNPTIDPNYNGNKPLFYQTPLVAGTTQQPLLVPVLQIHTPAGTPANSANVPSTGSGEQQNWMQTPIADATFNLIIAAGDNPTRDAAGTTPAEFNGGLPNFVMFQENWNKDGAPSTARISGSFIQFKRNAYGTAPFLSVLTSDPTPRGIFGYPQLYRISNNSPGTFTDWGRTPYYSAPRREWGFDVGLLSQLPDLFSQQITTPAVGDPNEFYREVGRDDPWVKTLLCAAVGQLQNPNSPNPPTYEYSNAYAVTDTPTPPQGGNCLPLNNY